MTYKPKSHRGLFDLNNITTQSLDGYISLHPTLTRLSTTPPYNVILRNPTLNNKSAPITYLISGGGDGHQPAHAGYIGEGMLTAAVSGGVFSSPSAEAVIEAVRGVIKAFGKENEQSVLLIVKNYTGDKLNFGLAINILKQQQPSLITDMVIVGDDVALTRDHSVAGRRGLAGTLLVHKLAGAAAAGGQTMEQVKSVATDVASRLCTLGVAFTMCSVGGKENNTLKESEMEIGLGIHGENGIRKERIDTPDRIVRDMIDMILSKEEDRDYFWREAADSDEVNVNRVFNISTILLVNNLSSMLPHEMSIISLLCLQELKERNLVVERVVTGTMMTAGDMRGFSVTLLRLPEDARKKTEWLRWFDAKTDAPAWPITYSTPPLPSQNVVLSPVISTSSNSIPSPTSSPLCHKILIAIANTFIDHSDALNRLDSHGGDGDCGTTFKQAASLLLADLRSSSTSSTSSARILITSTPALLFSSLRKYTAAMGGTSGAILSLLLISVSNTLTEKEGYHGWEAIGVMISEGLQRGVEEVTRLTGSRVGDRTMLDALVPSLSAFIDTLRSGEMSSNNSEEEKRRVQEAMKKSVEAGKKGMEGTKSLTARAGRASYTRSEVLNDVDPGAKAIVLILEAVCDSLH